MSDSGSAAEYPSTPSEDSTSTNKPWWEDLPPVPWGIGKVVQVMLSWLTAFWLLTNIGVPLTLEMLNLDRELLTSRGHAVVHLLMDVSQLSLCLGILWHHLRSYKPRESGFFPVRFSGDWYKQLWWCLAFPLVDLVAQQCLGMFPSEVDAWSSNLEQSLTMGDWIANISYFTVLSICAPIWEEALFRGFLLVSLTRVLPVELAILVSSFIFAMCHFKLQTFIPLMLLGLVFSLVFLRSKNLVPPVILHSLWNVYVMINLALRPW